MTIAASDITFTLSGGSTNNEPDDSLGGEPSVHAIANKKLFDDVPDDEALNGMTDYRCFYINNESQVDSLFNAKLYVHTQVDGGGTVDFGFEFQDERQTVSVTNTDQITSGNFVLTYSQVTGETNFTVTWNSDPVTWAANFQTAIRTVLNLEEVTVGYSVSGTTVSFEIDFVGTAGNRYHDIMVVDENNLSPNGIAAVSVGKTVDGSPINRIADEIDVDTTIPTAIVFETSSVDEPIELGELRPLDSVPIWVRRNVPEETTAVENDGFTFKLKGTALA